MQTKRKYYDILTSEGSNEATILLYGYIGEQYGWDDEKGWHQTGITDIDFVEELAALAAKYAVIHIRINSPGGEIFHGSAIVNAIRECPAEIHTWIDGVAASMAGVIWLAGKKRHMAKNGMLMIHSGSALCWGNAADMREIADTLDQFDSTLIISVADSTGMSEEDLKAKYFDYKDHWLTWNDVNAEGWITAAGEYTAATPMPKDIQNMSYRALVEFFNEKKHPEAPGLLQKLRAAWDNTIAAVTGGNTHSPSQSIQDMNLEDFKKSVGDGTLSLDDVKAHLATLSAAASAKADEPAPAQTAETEPTVPVAPSPDPAITATIEALKAQNATMLQQIQQLTETVAAYGQQPGAGKSTPAPPADGLPDPGSNGEAKALYAKMNADLIAAAARNEPANFLLAAE